MLLAGVGSSRLRADLFLDLIHRVTAEERTPIWRLFGGGLALRKWPKRQGAKRGSPVASVGAV